MLDLFPRLADPLDPSCALLEAGCRVGHWVTVDLGENVYRAFTEGNQSRNRGSG